MSRNLLFILRLSVLQGVQHTPKQTADILIESGFVILDINADLRIKADQKISEQQKSLVK